MAYLFYAYSDQNSLTLLPYVKGTYRESLSIEKDIVWSNRSIQKKKTRSKPSNSKQAEENWD